MKLGCIIKSARMSVHIPRPSNTGSNSGQNCRINVSVIIRQFYLLSAFYCRCCRVERRFSTTKCVAGSAPKAWIPQPYPNSMWYPSQLALIARATLEHLTTSQNPCPLPRSTCRPHRCLCLWGLETARLPRGCRLTP